jgi:hypothetical protein
MNEAAKALMQQITGITDEDLARLQPATERRMEKLYSNISQIMQQRLVAEVVQSEYCFAGIKEGDRIVFNPFLDRSETTCPLCPRALIPVLIAIQEYWERGFELADRGVEGVEAMNDSAFAGMAACMDPGLEYGGVGHVGFRVFSERIG